ncbi:YtpI family protein [Bacillus sp. OK048]|uniref:YtpI family protein n=1 Tax=Bacillus sp. OK048 TaxID=1882761 RepID=UPI00088E4408|nr:YtpI family protein [Bacillus sp. OK048]SDM26471.1 YtpI-like protein [Bacillus sp. OK048]
MSVLVFFIVILFAFYLFYKTKYFRSRRPVEKKWLAAKANIALGLFVCLFGLNHLFFISETTVTFIVSVIFIVYGGVFTWVGLKKYKHYLPFAAEEAINESRSS